MCCESWKLSEFASRDYTAGKSHGCIRKTVQSVPVYQSVQYQYPKQHPLKKVTLPGWQGLYSTSRQFLSRFSNNSKITLEFSKRVVQKYTTFLEPAFYESSSPPSLKFPSASSQARLKSCRNLTLIKTIGPISWSSWVYTVYLKVRNQCLQPSTYHSDGQARRVNIGVEEK